MNPEQCMLTIRMEGALVKKNYCQHKERLLNARIQFELQLKMFQSTTHQVIHNTSSRLTIHARVIFIGSYF